MINQTIQIGKNYGHCGASKFSENDDIYANRDEYWIHNCALNTELRIDKHCAQGKQLTEAIQKGGTKGHQKWLDKLALKHITTAQLYKKIKELKREYIQKGRGQAQAEMREALGLTL